MDLKKGFLTQLLNNFALFSFPPAAIKFWLISEDAVSGSALVGISGWALQFF